jgi:hypothetical protein
MPSRYKAKGHKRQDLNYIAQTSGVTKAKHLSKATDKFSVLLLDRTQVTCQIEIQGDSRLADITAGDDFLGLCDQTSSYKHVSDFGRLRSYDRLKLRIEGNDY